MTNEERDLIAQFIARVGGAPQQGGFLTGGAGSVPQSQAPLPPIDRDADAFIAQQFQLFPEARYRITQTAVVQEAALAESANRIRRLEWELEQTRQAMQQAQQRQPQQNRGFFGSLFGGGQPQQPSQQRGPFGAQGGPQPGYGYQPTSAPPPPQYPPNYQPGMFQRGGGSGFLGSALTTAAGVAGGLVVGNALMNAFSGHSGGGLGGGLASTASNPFDTAGSSFGSDPAAGFASNTGFSDPFAGGGEAKSFDDGGFSQSTSYDQGGGDPFGSAGGFDSGGGGFDSGGGGGFDSGSSDST